MSDFKFNKCDDYTIILTNRSYVPYGHIANYKVDDINFKKNMNSANEFSFTVYKYMTLEDGTEYEEPLWDKITDLKLIYVKETNEYYEITVDGTDSLATYKTVTGKSLCEAELSQYNLYGIEINTEDDIARDEYVQPTLFYRSLDGLEVGSDAYNIAKDSSLLHRILYGSGKANNYKIKHVDESIANLQRTFSIDGKSIYDFFTGDCAEQFNCLFLFDSTDRSISVYDLYSVCMNDDCSYRLSDKDNPRHLRYRGDFKDVCPKCGSKHIKVYGKDTMVIVDKENLTDEISFSTNSDELKNCFHLKAGDDDMTAAIININPNGTAYLYYVPEYQREDMSKELVDKLVTYDELYDSYTNEYEQLMLNLYNAIDWQLYYMDEMMPGAIPPDERESSGSTEIVTKPVETAEQQIPKLSVNNLNYTALSSITSSTSLSTVESAIKNYAKVFVNTSKFKIETIEDSLGSVYQSGGNNCVKWTGKFKVTNFSDKDDTATSSSITLTIYDNYEEFVNQKIKKSIATDDPTGSIYDVLKIDSLDRYKDAIKLYGIARLQSFIESIKNVEDILIQQGNQAQELYYGKYHNMEIATEKELDARQVQYDAWIDKETKCSTRKSEIQEVLNFENYLGSELYGEFCAYRRDQDYSNDNYISDGLNNTDLFSNAREFIKTAQEELKKAATLQCNISCKVKNLFALDEFKPFWDSFQIGNWITVGYDNEYYRLRVISINGSLSDFSNIDVEFSSVTRISNVTTNIKDVLNQAQSMATNYSYISRQSNNGQKANDTLSEFQKKSMNASLYRLKNNDKEEIVIDNHGITARSWNDILDDYDPEQFAITHNTLNFTYDNWATCSLALGKHDYRYWNGSNFAQKTGYGLSTKFVQSGYVIGSQFIGGELYSENYQPNICGTHFNFNTGSFTLGGDKIKYDSAKDQMTVKGLEIKWDEVNKPTVPMNNVDGLEKYITDLQDQIDQKIDTYYQATVPTWDTNENAKHIGDLWFNTSKTDVGNYKAQTNYRFNGSIWELYGIVPKDVYDKIDGVASIYSTIPSNPQENDTLIPNSDFTVGNTTYISGKIYKYQKVDDDYVWSEVKYTDMEEVESKGYQTSEQVTTITKDTISTTNVLAKNLQVNSANIQGELSADKIKGGTLTGDTNIQLGKFPDGASPWLYKYAVVVDNDIYQPDFNIYNPSQKMFGAACTCLINGTLFFEYENEYGGSRRSHIEMGSTYVDYSAGNLIGKTDIYSDRIEIIAFTTSTSTTNIYTRVYAGHVDTSSDRRLKNDIQFIDTKFDAFINKLCDMPVSYYFNGQEFDGHRIGFIAQDVEKAIIDCGLTHDDINIVRKDDVKDDKGNVIDYTYSLTYTDFIGLLFRKNRMQDDEINKMQNEIDILKKEVEELKNAINRESN